MLFVPSMGVALRDVPAPAWVKGAYGGSGGTPPPDIAVHFDEGRAYQKGKSSFALTDILTCARNSVAYANNSAGVWTQFPINTMRITDLGCLTETGKTNSIRNNSMQGAVVGTPGTLPTNWIAGGGSGLVPSVVGTGTENGVDYIDIRVNGTTAAGNGNTNIFFENATSVAALTGQTWTYSVFLKMVAGSFSNIIGIVWAINENTSAGAQVTTHQSNLATSSAPLLGALGNLRVARTDALTGGATVAAVQPLFQVSANVASAIDITLRIGWPQLEQGGFASSPIRTTSAAVVRPADIITVANPPAIPGPVSMYTAYTNQGVGVGGWCSSATIGQVGDSVNNVVIMYDGQAGGGSRNVQVFVGSAVQGTAVAGNMVIGYPQRAAAAVAPGDIAMSRNGAPAVVVAGTGSFPSSLAVIWIGWGRNQALNGFLTRAAFWVNKRLSNAQLQALTAASPWMLQGDGVVANTDLDFQNGVYWNRGAAVPLAGLLTCVRSISAYADDTNGNWTLFAPNVARITNKGLLVEEPRTNGVRNNVGLGAVPGTPGTIPTNWALMAPSPYQGVSTDVWSSGVINGVDTVTFHIYGTPAATFGLVTYFEQPTVIAAANGQQWVVSAFIQFSNLNNVGPSSGFSIYEINSVGAGLANQLGTTFYPLVLTRGSYVFTLGQATTAYLFPGFQIHAQAGLPLDLLFTVGWPQAEQGQFATSPIRTTGAAVQRPGETVALAQIPTFTNGKYTVYTAGSPLLGQQGTNRNLISLSNTGANRTEIYSPAGSNALAALYMLGFVAQMQAVIAGGLWDTGTSLRSIFAVAGGDQAATDAPAGAGVSITPGTGVGTFLPSEIYIGSLLGGGSNWLNGYITRVAIWPDVRISNNTLTGIVMP